MSIYDYEVERANGEMLKLEDYKGKVMVIVNTATGCGFTPHYEPLEAMYEKYHDAGFEIIDVPCNQFMGQTPGTDEEIHEFCTLNYHTQFPQMKKADVNGEKAIPLFTYLKSQKGFEGMGKGVKAMAMSVMLKKMDKDYKNNPDIKWNFTKFVVDREGNVVGRFEPTADMKELENCVASLMQRSYLMKNYDSLKLENQLCFPLYAASKEIVKHYKPFLDKLDMTYTQYITMMVLWEHKKLTVKELGKHLYLDSGTLTPLLKTMEKKGWVTRCRSTEDERLLNVSITAQGESLKEKAVHIPEQMAGYVKLEKKETIQLYKALYKILAEFQE